MTFDERAEILRQSIESRDRRLAKSRNEWKNTQAEIGEVGREVRELNQTVKASLQGIERS